MPNDGEDGRQDARQDAPETVDQVRKESVFLLFFSPRFVGLLVVRFGRFGEGAATIRWHSGGDARDANEDSWDSSGPD